MIRKLLNVLYRQVPAPMVVVLLLELYALVLLPTDPFAWVLVWHQFGFAMMMGLRPVYPGPPSAWRLMYWVFREAMFWPEIVYRFCKG